MAIKTTNCPCGNSKTYKDCCGAFHSGKAAVETAEELMRSRFTAFSLSEFDYLLATTFSTNRDSDLADLRRSNANCDWLSLEIVNSDKGGHSDSEGTVEFIAAYYENQQVHFMHENSRFIRGNGRWLYVDGDMLESKPPIPQSKNAPCFCGSQRKFKRCHG